MTTKYEFIMIDDGKGFSKSYPERKMRYTIKDIETANEVCEAFGEFLKGCGFHLDTVGVIQDDEEVVAYDPDVRYSAKAKE